MKVRIQSLSDRQRIETLDSLYTAASSLTSRHDMKLFLRDLLTPSERVMLGRRILIARMLLRGCEYQEICEQLRVGSSTIRRVHRWLADQLPGYENAIRAMEEQIDNRRFKARNSWKSALRRLKIKYPLHFLLFPDTKQR